MDNAKGQDYDLDVKFSIDNYTLHFNISDFLKTYAPDICLLNLNIEYYDPDIFPDDYTGKYHVILGDALLSRYHEFHVNFETEKAGFRLGRPVPPKPTPEKEGLPVWALIIIILASVVVLGAVGVVIYNEWSKRKREGIKEYGRLSHDLNATEESR